MAKKSKKAINKKASKKVAKRRAGKKVAKRKTATKKVKKALRRVSGYRESSSGLMVPDSLATPVPPSKLQAGFTRARKEINALVDELVANMTEDYRISEIELAASFSADGKFLGIGVGGAATITIRIAPQR